VAVTLEQDGDRILIHFNDTVDITCAAELKQLLVQALDSHKEIAVDMEQAGSIDVTAVQLLWAATRAATAGGIDFALAGPVPDGVLAQLREAGFDEFPVPAALQAAVQ
jgi:anti-anti-sigma factor